jgi:hypothetical protein
MQKVEHLFTVQSELKLRFIFRPFLKVRMDGSDIFTIIYRSRDILVTQIKHFNP